MKKRMLIAALVVFGMAGIANAVETAYGDLGIDVDATYVSKYIWRGIDKYDDKAAFQPSVNFDLFDSGWSFNVWYSVGGASGNVNGEEIDYTVTYGNSVCEGQAWQTDYAASYVYYDYPDQPSDAADAMEFNLALSWPDICPFGTVPSYTGVYIWGAEGGGAARDIEGFIHVFGLSKDFDVAYLPNPVTFGWNLTYNDDAAATNIDHEFSHTVFGLSTSIEAPGGGTISPAIYYQISMEDDVNTEDELWTGLSYTVSF